MTSMLTVIFYSPEERKYRKTDGCRPFNIQFGGDKTNQMKKG
jgi:hypothetical protein